MIKKSFSQFLSEICCISSKRSDSDDFDEEYYINKKLDLYEDDTCYTRSINISKEDFPSKLMIYKINKKYPKINKIIINKIINTHFDYWKSNVKLYRNKLRCLEILTSGLEKNLQKLSLRMIIGQWKCNKEDFIFV